MNKGLLYKTFCIPVCLFLCLCAFCCVENSVLAQESIFISDIYIVSKGDTLWDISDRFFGDPFIWPSLWQRNPHIKDPHWIYPGQIINLRDLPLPGSLKAEPVRATSELPKEAKPKTPPEAAAVPVPPKTQYIVSQDRIDSCSYIVPKQSIYQRQGAQRWGRIIDAKEDKVSYSYLDYIYINYGAGRVKTDQILTIFRVEEGLRGPANLEIPYSMIRILGKAKVMEVHPDLCQARIIKSYAEIYVGDLVKHYETTPRPVLKPPERKDLEGELLAGEEPKEYIAAFDLVFLNIGKRDGLEQGNLLDIYRFDEIQTGAKQIKTTRLLQPLGKLVVLRVEEDTSTALINKSFQPIKLGDRVRVHQD